MMSYPALTRAPVAAPAQEPGGLKPHLRLPTGAEVLPSHLSLLETDACVLWAVNHSKNTEMPILPGISRAA